MKNANCTCRHWQLYILMLTWRRGRKLVGESQKRHAIPLDSFLQSLFFSPPQRVKGTAVFLRGENDGVPQALLHNLSHNTVLTALLLSRVS